MARTTEAYKRGSKVSGSSPPSAAVLLTPAYAASLMAIDWIGQAEGHRPKGGQKRRASQGSIWRSNEVNAVYLRGVSSLIWTAFQNNPQTPLRILRQRPARAATQIYTRLLNTWEYLILL